jgi:hypothetical protein
MQGCSVVVLNMANQTRAGGGYKTGAGAQEENLHRRSNLFEILDDPFGAWPDRPWSFPIDDFGAVYSPVRRASSSTFYYRRFLLLIGCSPRAHCHRMLLCFAALKSAAILSSTSLNTMASFRSLPTLNRNCLIK